MNDEEKIGTKPNPTSLPHRILVVDDESAMRHLIATALTPCGYHVDAAEDGAAAWEALQVKQYDLVITDNNMPKVSGVELIEKLHATAKALPVIMATGEAPEHEFRRKPWLQPAAMLLKPFSVRDLRETVERTLRAALGPPKADDSYVL
jgi:two-component system chemotaxis response regulator CheY